MTRPSTGLPQELIDNVVDFMSDDEQSLRASCLAFRAIVPQCQHYLFASITLYRRGSRNTQTNSVTDLYRTFRRLMIRSPHLRPLVKHLHFVSDKHHPPSYFNFPEMIRKLPSIQHISLSGQGRGFSWWAPEIHDALKGVATRPTFQAFHLTLDGVPPSKAIMGLPNLKDITYVSPKSPESGISWREHESVSRQFNDAVSCSPSAIRSLRVELSLDFRSNADGRPNELATTYKWLNLKNLQMLSVESDSFIDTEIRAFGWVLDYLRHSYNSLRVLVICPRNFVLQLPYHHSGLDLSRLPNLKSLRISFVYRHLLRLHELPDSFSGLPANDCCLIEPHEPSPQAAPWLARLLETADPSTTLDELSICVPFYSSEALQPFDTLLDGYGYHSIGRVVMLACDMSSSEGAEEIRGALTKLSQRTEFAVKIVEDTGMEKEIWSGFMDYTYI